MFRGSLYLIGLWREINDSVFFALISGYNFFRLALPIAQHTIDPYKVAPWRQGAPRKLYFH